ncbi:MAG TPA: SDR family oxidoreductase [Galbitalea sp.]|nr:SDR family oxidoreductase [Galbitalea sp.]
MIGYRGSTVLVTGASSGLGAEFASQLAARGANLILVARRAERLEALKADLLAKHGVIVNVIPTDLAAAGASSALAAKITKLGLPVHSLINNAGFGSHNRFEDEDADRVHEEVALNVAAVVDLSKVFYTELLQHGTGVLVNVASTAAFQPVPRMAVYGASKAFVLSFTEALWFEARPSGLKVIALCPGATATEFFDVAGPEARTGRVQSASTVVGIALRALDRRNPPPSVVTGFTNVAATIAERLMPRRALVSAVGRLTRGRSR